MKVLLTVCTIRNETSSSDLHFTELWTFIIRGSTIKILHKKSFFRSAIEILPLVSNQNPSYGQQLKSFLRLAIKILLMVYYQNPSYDQHLNSSCYANPSIVVSFMQILIMVSPALRMWLPESGLRRAGRNLRALFIFFPFFTSYAEVLYKSVLFYI